MNTNRSYIFKLKLLAIMMLIMGGCNNFLDIRPVGELPDEQLFKDHKGFENALYGVYATLNKGDLYGRTLSHETIEMLAQYFDVQGNEYVLQLKNYNYQHSQVEATLYSVWKEMYNNISNVNNILAHLENHPESSMRFYDLYKGEALGLRAFMHFDLLRLYAENYETAGTGDAIPYSTKFSLSPSDFVTVQKAYELIINDLVQAEELLAQDTDLVTSPKVNPDEPFIRDRETHFNLYAVQATLARVYFTKGDYPNAALYAQKVIDSNKFSLLDKTQFAAGDIRGILYPQETIFGVYSTSWFAAVRDRFHFETSFFSYNPRSDIKDIYEKEQRGHDYRWEGYFRAPATSAGRLRFAKLVDTYQLDDREFMRPEESIVGINMIRLPEMYYILAESLLTTDHDKARDYFDEVLDSRGLTPLKDRIEPSEQQLNLERINDERYKEFIGEGQTFFNLKRINADITATDNSVIPASKAIYVWPVPFDELEYNNKVTEK